MIDDRSRPPCPNCHCEKKVYANGFYVRRVDRRKIKRFRCVVCNQCFSQQTNRYDYRLKRVDINQICFREICSGVAYSDIARNLDLNYKAVIVRVKRFGGAAAKVLQRERKELEALDHVMFDELETCEHTKCKPVTAAIAVEPKKRRVLGFAIGAIAAKGHLAKISRKKYGHRKCERQTVLDQLLINLKDCVKNDAIFTTDMSHHYPPAIKKHFSHAIHDRKKGRRGCVTGQGELKEGGFDPLFSLNHTYAMFRCKLKQLTRRTWAIPKIKERLNDLFSLYAVYHNARLNLQRYKSPGLEILI